MALSHTNAWPSVGAVVTVSTSAKLLTVPAKLVASPIEAANSFNVFNVPGAESIKPLMAVSISACFATPVKALPSPWNAVAFTVPFTSNFCVGLFVPIPTFPFGSIRILSVPAVPNTIFLVISAFWLYPVKSM